MMKSVLDKETRNELISRINRLNESSGSEWGKMNIYQMVKHCRLWEEMIINNKPYKRVLAGRIFGRMALKSVLKDDTPIMRNSPTVPELVVRDNGELLPEKTKWMALIEAYENYNSDFVHPFFGKMTREQVGYFAYKHSDHHLRQFNC